MSVLSATLKLSVPDRRRSIKGLPVIGLCEIQALHHSLLGTSEQISASN